MRVLLFLLFFAPIVCIAQEEEDRQGMIDSLKQVIEKAKHDTTIINAWFAWDNLIYYSDPDLDLELNTKIYKFCKEVLVKQEPLLKESLKKFYQRNLGSSLNNLGLIYHALGDYSKAIDCHTQSLNIKKVLGNKKGLSSSYTNLGLIYHDQGDHGKALDSYNQSRKIDEELGDLGGIASNLTNIGIVYQAQGDDVKAIEYHKKALKINEEVGNKKGKSSALNNIGNFYEAQTDFVKALDYYTQSLIIKKEIGYGKGIATTLSNIGNIYSFQGNITKALEHFSQSLEIFEEIGNKTGSSISLHKIGNLHENQGEDSKAILYNHRSLELAKEIGFLEGIEAASESLYKSHKKRGDKGLALQMYEEYISSRDSLDSEENQKEIIRQEFKYSYEKQALADSIQHFQEQRIVKAQLAGQKQRSSFLFGGLALSILFGLFIFNRFRVTQKQKIIIEDQKELVEKERDRSDNLLLNILPKDTAAELKENGSVAAQFFAMTSVLFTDFKGFTAISEKMRPEELLEELNYCFSEFDAIMQRNAVEKIKTIGDAYMAACGVPVADENHAKNIVKAALEIKDFMLAYAQNKESEKKPYFEVRIGVHSGPLVAGVVGTQKFQYDVWGDTVNVASRMESNGEAGKVNISDSTFQLLKEQTNYTFTSRGEISVKGKGKLAMHFVDG